MATLDELAAFVESATDFEEGTDLFKGLIPEEPDECVVLREYPGTLGRYTFGVIGVTTEAPRVQIVCRGAREDYATPRDTAETIYQALSAVANQSLSSTRYLSVTPLQPPFPLGTDANARVSIVFNVAIEKAVSA